MRKSYIAFIILSVLAISCSKPTQKDLIEKAFKEYVNINFDDPKSLKEIVSIEVSDTAYNAILELVGKLHELDSIIVACDSLYNPNTSLDKFTQDLKKQQHLINDMSYYDKEKIIETANKCVNSGIKLVTYNKNAYRQKLESTDSTFNRLSPTNIILYKIHAREEYDKNLKLKNYYALADSTNIRIYKDEPPVKDYSTEIGKFMTLFEDCFETQQKYLSLITDFQDNINKLKEVCREAGIFIY